MTHGMPKAPTSNAPTLNAAWVSQLPVAPAHVLLLGIQRDAHAAQLEALGYQVNAQSLNASQALAQFPTPTRQPIGQVSLSLPGSEAASFAAALVLDFSPQIHPLALWDQLAHWLAEDAVVILVGQGAAGTPPRMPKWLDYVVAIGARCGFTEQALPEGAGASGTDGFVRVFRKAAAPRWQVRHVRTTDFDEIATLFQEVFGHPISRELWTWKYANGHGNGVVAARHGALIAHYGGMYRDVMLCGKPDWVFQICDVMVHPKERGVMTRQGPFLLTAATSAEIYGPLGFGFPNARAMEVAAKMGLYSEVGQMSEVRWEPSEPRFRLRTRLQPVVHGSAASQALVESSWAAMAKDLQSDVVGVRDWAFVEHRYFSHPHNQYEVLAVISRFTGKPLGVMVLRRLEAMCELVDVITPLANLPLLIDQARRLTGLWKLPYLYCWITRNHLPRFVATEGQEVALNVSIPTSCWTDDPRADIFKDRWWLMSGDTDFR
ncbi:MAG: GNAT family N-acetyltransferase [Rhodoferax sp.]|nr:GNAT family N-acetyltransferase [Rhodoferax sp.]